MLQAARFPSSLSSTYRYYLKTYIHIQDELEKRGRDFKRMLRVINIITTYVHKVRYMLILMYVPVCGTDKHL